MLFLVPLDNVILEFLDITENELGPLLEPLWILLFEFVVHLRRVTPDMHEGGKRVKAVEWVAHGYDDAI